MRSVHVVSLIASMALATTPAMATTASAICTVADANMRLDAASAVGSSIGGPLGPWHLSGLNGRMEVLAKGAPASLRSITLKHEELAQHWNYGQTLNINLSVIRPGAKDDATADLVIETRRPNAKSTDYSGGYVLTVIDEGRTWTFRGQARCRLIADE